MQNTITRGDHILCPIPGTKIFRRTYELGSDWIRETARSELSKNQIEDVLKSSGVKYHIEEVTWEEEVGACDFRCKQDHFVIKT